MPQLKFNGTHYYGGRYRFTEPGVYEVEVAKADQLLADFPDQFEAVEGDQEPAKPVSKMNKDELVAHANDIGAEINDDMTNKELQEVIKTHQEG